MRIVPKVALSVRPDSNGEYPDALALRLIQFGLAELPVTTQEPVRDNDHRKRGKRRR